MGVIGGFCFVGLFYWHFVGTSSRRNVANAASSPIARDLWASAIGIAVAASFLSRQHVPVLYIPLALGATRIVVERRIDAQPLSTAWDWILAALWTGVAVAGIYIGVRSLAIYG